MDKQIYTELGFNPPDQTHKDDLGVCPVCGLRVRINGTINYDVIIASCYDSFPVNCWQKDETDHYNR